MKRDTKKRDTKYCVSTVYFNCRYTTLCVSKLYRAELHLRTCCSAINNVAVKLFNIHSCGFNLLWY
jgi:hypothetical protein